MLFSNLPKLLINSISSLLNYDSTGKLLLTFTIEIISSESVYIINYINFLIFNYIFVDTFCSSEFDTTNVLVSESIENINISSFLILNLVVVLHKFPLLSKP